MGMPPPHSVQRVGEDEEDEPIQEALRGGVASRKSSISYATAAEAAVHFEEGQGGKRGLRDARSNAPTERDDAPTTTTAISEQVRRPAGPWRESSQGASSVDDEEADNALLGLAAPPSYDVHVRALSISPPPWRAYIPAPIPIPIPRSLTKMMGLGPQGKKSEGNGKGKRIEVESRSDKREEDVEKAQTAQSSGERADLEAGATRLADMAPITALPTRLQSNGGLTEEEQEEEGVGSIVREVEWKVRGGEMAAIIGGSGSGKTTLLHAIASRLGDLQISHGDVFIAPSADMAPCDEPSRPSAAFQRPSSAGGTAEVPTQPSARSSKARRTSLPVGGSGHFKGLSKVLGFVKQHDYLLPHLTVRETLESAAALRLPASVSASTRAEIVTQTLRELGMNDAEHTLVGGAGGRKGISGGERRRLTIGCVLVTLPSVLCLDEPTTGLDAFTAYQLLETLGRLAKRGRTIILSIHQPRSDAYQLFDQLLLLSHGEVMYAGARSDCLPYFSGLGFDTPQDTNPMDYLIDISSVDSRSDESEERSRACLSRLSKEWRRHQTLRELELAGRADGLADDSFAASTRSIFLQRESVLENQPLTEASKKRSSVLAGVLEQTRRLLKDDPDKRPNSMAQVLVLVPRSFRNGYRAYAELLGHLLQSIVIGVVMGLIFFQVNSSPGDVQSLKTLCLQMAAAMYYLSQTVWIYKWCQVLVIFDREREDHLYSPLAWVLSEFVVNLPVNVIAPVIYAVILYFIAGLRTDNLASNLGYFIADNILLQHCFVGFGLLAASLDRSFARASLICNSMAVFFIMSVGFFVVPVPGWIRWFRWLSPYFYNFRIATLSQFRDRMFPCPGATGSLLAQCDGNGVLRGLGISPNQPLYPMFLGLLGFIIVCHGLSVLLLTVHHPGGVRHAARINTEVASKDLAYPELDLVRQAVDVEASNVKLRYASRALPNFKLEEKAILANMNARFPSGQVSAVMGPSGSGKSSFLRLCAARDLKGGLLGSFQMSGDITFNGMRASSKTRQLAAFVEQEDDYHLPALSVRETLRYAAILKLPAEMSRKRKYARAEEVLRMLGLTDCANGVVGGELLKGISGGEKRRLSLACQMINDPSVLVLDEPTSGLDSATAFQVMQVLENIARTGRCVIISVHQPRSDIFHLVDRVLLLGKGGNVVYEGERSGMLSHFAGLGYKCPSFFNPADYALDLVSVDLKSNRRYERSSRRVNELVTAWRDHDEKRVAQKLGTAPLPVSSKIVHTPIHIALPVILERSVRNMWRQQDLFWMRWIQAPVLAICFYIFFLRIPDGDTGGQTRIGLIAQSSSAVSFVGFLNLVALYPPEKAIFFHEYQSAGGAYGSATFITSFSLVAIIPELVSAFAYTAIIFPGTGMRTTARIFFEDTVCIWAQLSFGESLGIMVASLFDTEGLSVSIISVVMTVASQASAIFSASVIGFLADIAWIFPMKYSAQIMSLNEFTGLVFNCSEQSIQSGACSYSTGDAILNIFGYHDHTWLLMIILVLVTIAWRVVAWTFVAARMRFV